MAKPSSPERRPTPPERKPGSVDSNTLVADIRARMRGWGDKLKGRFDRWRQVATPEEAAEEDDIEAEALELVEDLEKKISPDAIKSSLAGEVPRNDPSLVTHLTDDVRQTYAIFDGSKDTANLDERAASVAMATIQAELKNISPSSSVEEIKTALTHAFGEKIDTHGIVCQIHEGTDGQRTAVIAYAGDTRAYLREPDGNLERVTTDDDTKNVKFKIIQRPLNKGDKLLFVTAGMDQALSDEEMARALEDGTDGETTVNQLVDLAKTSNAAEVDKVALLLQWQKSQPEPAKVAPTAPLFEQVNITGNPELMEKLADLLQHTTAINEGLIDTLGNADTTVREVSEALDMSKEAVITALKRQRQALVEQAAAEERAGRKFTTALGKAALYTVGGLAVASNPLLLGVALPAARVADTLLTHGARETNRKKIERNLFNAVHHDDTTRDRVLASLAANLAIEKNRELTDEFLNKEGQDQSQVALALLAKEAQRHTTTPIEPSRLKRFVSGVLGYRHELISEKLSSVAFFTAMGAVARDHVAVRVALSGYAGARLGEAAASMILRRMDAKVETESNVTMLTQAKLDAINLNDDVLQTIKNLQPAAALTRERLQDGKRRLQNAIEYRTQQELLQRYEQLRIWANAKAGLDDLLKTETAALQDVKKITLRRKILHGLIKGGAMLVVGLSGAVIGAELAERAAQHAADRLKDAKLAAKIPPITSTDSVPESATAPTQPAETADAPARVIKTKLPNAESPTPEATTTAPTETPSTAASESVPAEPPELPGALGIVHQGKGLIHAMRDEFHLNDRTINQLLHDTKVTLHGRPTTLLDTGLRHPDEVGVSVHEVDGHKVVELYDLNTQTRIPDDRLDDYLYIRSEGPGIEQPSVEPIPAVEANQPPTSPEEFRPPAEHETSQDYIAAGLRNYIDTHPDYAPLAGLSDEALLQEPALGRIHENLIADYREATQAVSGGGASAETAPPLVNKLVTEAGRLTPAGLRRLNLAEHLSRSGVIQRWPDFKEDFLALFQATKADRLATPNGLVFEERDGKLFVDLAGGARNAYPMDEQLYTALMERFKNSIEPDHGGRFDRESFYAVLNQPTVEASPDLPALNLSDYIHQARPLRYEQFTRDLNRFMDAHQVNSFEGPNNLTFSRSHGQFYVDISFGVADRAPLTPEVYQTMMERFMRFGYDRAGRFDTEQFLSVTGQTPPHI